MNIRFKGHNYHAQGLAGTCVRYNGEIVGEVVTVVDDEIIVKLKPGDEEKFKELLESSGPMPSLASKETE